MNRNRMRPSPIKKQRGLALVTVLLVISLCVILAAEMTTTQSYQVKRVTNLFERQQAYWYAMGAEHFVKALLKDTAQKDKGVVNLSQPWAMEGMSFPVDNGLIEGKIQDLRSCFNLNSLYEKDIAADKLKFRKEAFVRYLEQLDIQSENSHEDLAENLYDWLDPDDYPSGAVGYDGDMYASLAFPYLSANSPLAHENELRVIYGFDAAVMMQLKDKFCVVPGNSEFVFNINTLNADEPELLMAILDIDDKLASDILAERPDDGYEAIADLWATAPMKKVKSVTEADKYFTVESKFFKLITNAYYNDMKFALTSVIQLDDNNKTQVVGRRFGGNVERETDTEDEQPAG